MGASFALQNHIRASSFHRIHAESFIKELDSGHLGEF